MDLTLYDRRSRSTCALDRLRASWPGRVLTQLIAEPRASGCLGDLADKFVGDHAAQKATFPQRRGKPQAAARVPRHVFDSFMSSIF